VSYNYKPDRETHAFRCTVLSISAYRMCISLSLSVLSVERERWRLIVGRREMKKIEEISGIEHLVRSKKREREREREFLLEPGAGTLFYAFFAPTTNPPLPVPCLLHTQTRQNPTYQFPLHSTCSLSLSLTLKKNKQNHFQKAI
jgi:hypothetical protein